MAGVDRIHDPMIHEALGNADLPGRTDRDDFGGNSASLLFPVDLASDPYLMSRPRSQLCLSSWAQAAQLIFLSLKALTFLEGSAC